jgi:hypothetical protein
MTSGNLRETNPELRSLWNTKRNAPDGFESVTRYTKDKFWWICELGHEWEILPEVVARGARCPFCANIRVLPGFNDLITKNPEVLEFWNWGRNFDTKPESISPGTKKKFWWTCSKGHEWETLPSVLARGGRCPFCSNNKVLKGFNDLATTHPELALEWHPTLNLPTTPHDVIAGGHGKYWWQCSLQHAWLTAGKNRLKGQGCGVCSNRRVSGGVNDLATTHPDLATEWHPTKNLPLTPNDIFAGSPRKMWWQCSEGHEWMATSNSRTSGRRCPFCSNNRVLAGFNDLATTHPQIAAEWHPSRNAPITPIDVIAGTPKRIWWQCREGHEWIATGNKRYMKRGCPSCASFGFDSSQSGVLYFIESQALKARKIGIMNEDSGRLATFKKLGWDLILKKSHKQGAVIRDVETHIFRWIRKDLGLPQYLSKDDMGTHRGETETFSLDGVAKLEVAAKIEALFEEIEAKHKIQ